MTTTRPSRCAEPICAHPRLRTGEATTTMRVVCLTPRATRPLRKNRLRSRVS